MRLVVALTVNSGDKVLEGAAVKGESGRPLPLMVLLNGLEDQLFLKDEAGTGITECRLLRHCIPYACMQTHA